MKPWNKRRIARIALFTVILVLLFMAFSGRFMNDTVPDLNLADSLKTHSPGTSAQLLSDSSANPENALSSTPVPTPPVRSKPAPGQTYAKKDSVSTPESTPVLRPKDTTPPVVTADPGPGLHPAPITVTLRSNEPGLIEMKIGAEAPWQPYSLPVPVSDSLSFSYRATDSSGNSSETLHRIYVIRKPSGPACPDNMVPVKTNGKFFCIDRYEWPNQKGRIPASFVSWFMAFDSCRMVKKRLCTAMEWEAACGGASNTDYPYGSTYEQSTCNTETGGALPSGSRPECRSWSGAYDLSGNLREWTDTRSVKNSRHYQVYGGYWENRGASRCNSTQYSFFPENSFTSVGFRCCTETDKR